MNLAVMMDTHGEEILDIPFWNNVKTFFVVCAIASVGAQYGFKLGDWVYHEYIQPFIE